ncbi:MAG TPA: hypothetical protein VHS28_07935, partial [Chloroflexota bacterium]|nr:hypothetical protein [Chloroflexota bacterium]
MITSILSDTTAREPLQGPNSPLKLTRPAAAKTGSTDDYKDSWTIGYTPDLTTGVWVGNTDNSAMKEVVGSLGAGRIWHQFMEDVHAGTSPIDFVPPPGIQEYRVCKETGKLPTPDCPHVLTEVYPDGYDYAKTAVIPGLPIGGVPQQSRPTPVATPLGRTISQSGDQLQPTATTVPGETPSPEEIQPTAQTTPAVVGPAPAATASSAPAAAAPGPTQGAAGPVNSQAGSGNAPAPTSRPATAPTAALPATAPQPTQAPAPQPPAAVTPRPAPPAQARP